MVVLIMREVDVLVPLVSARRDGVALAAVCSVAARGGGSGARARCMPCRCAVLFMHASWIPSSRWAQAVGT